jgi:coenzyme F420 biosynthesis associated uncharacterized protein
MIDWDVATSTGVRWARPGPQVTLAEARKVVAELQRHAAAAIVPVRELTGMTGPDGPAEGGAVAVVDRPGWIRANVSGFRVVLEPLVEHMQRQGTAPPPGSVIGTVGSRVTGMQAGLILAYLSGRVLGQYELFLPPDPERDGADAPAGRLTLVAPNIVMVERELGVDSHDFRRWVCLHEETHRIQFTSVPWLRSYVQRQMTEFLLASDLDPGSILDRIRAAADAVAGAVRPGRQEAPGAPGEAGGARGDGGSRGGRSGSLIEALQTPRQREILDRLTAVMTLVEGHGDYVMDAVGPAVVPSVAQIRARFAARRASAGRVEQAIRRLLGIDLKMRQYEQGSKFVATVVREAGMSGFNAVWTSPDTLPTRDEIASPLAWLKRVDARRADRSEPGESGGAAAG